MIRPFDCSDVFPDYDHADAVVIESSVRVRLWSGGTHSHLTIDADKVSNFLEKVRRQQEP